MMLALLKRADVGFLAVEATANFWNESTPVIENSEPNFRFGSEAEVQTETLPDFRLLWTNRVALLGLSNFESRSFTTACSGQSASGLSKWMPVLVRSWSSLLSGSFGIRDDLRCS
jgi:hypothetical protein